MDSAQIHDLTIPEPQIYWTGAPRITAQLPRVQDDPRFRLMKMFEISYAGYAAMRCVWNGWIAGAFGISSSRKFGKPHPYDHMSCVGYFFLWATYPRETCISRGETYMVWWNPTAPNTFWGCSWAQTHCQKVFEALGKRNECFNGNP